MAREQYAHLQQANIGKRLADALEERDAINKEIEQYEAAIEDENTCVM